MFRQLLWKEWRENLWKLIFCGAISLAFTALLFRIRLFPDGANCTIISFMQMIAVPLVYALDIFSGEMSNRTIHLLFKFPVARWKIFFSKYLICILGMSIIFLATGLLMELLGHGREADMSYLFKINGLCGLSSLVLFTWFCAFGAQSHSEAGSLVAMFSVFIGWGIVLFWSTMCEVVWAIHFVPYSLTVWVYEGADDLLRLSGLVFCQILTVVVTVSIACYRFVKVRRYL
jgi:ABC-type transport system involved in multi-copper enzyme maturation permease subunit